MKLSIQRIKYLCFCSLLLCGLLYVGIASAQMDTEQTDSDERKPVQFFLDLNQRPFNQNLVQPNVTPDSLFRVAVYAENLPLIFGQSFEVKFDHTRVMIQGFKLYFQDEKNIMVANFRELTNSSETINQIEDFIQTPLIETLEEGLIRISTKVSSGEPPRMFSYEGTGLLGSIFFQVKGHIDEVIDIELQVQKHKIAYAIPGLVETLLDMQQAQLKIIPQYALIAGDFDDSGYIDFTDFLLFVQGFDKNAQSTDWQPLFDLNQDMTIDFSDFSMFAQNFGKRTK